MFEQEFAGFRNEYPCNNKSKLQINITYVYVYHIKNPNESIKPKKRGN